MERREFIINFTIGAAGLALAPRLGFGQADPWKTEYPQILARIKSPTFPKKDFSILKFGAKPGGTFDCREAINGAIDACAKAGGGRVVVPAGEFLTGAIRLRSNVNLYVSKGATLKFSTDPKAYLPIVHTRWEGMELMHLSPLVYAFEETNVAITGEGTLDGQGKSFFWKWHGNPNYGGNPDILSQRPARARLYEMMDKGVPVAERIFGEGHYLRPQFIQPYRCKNVLIEGVKIVDSPMWEVHPVLCTNVTVKGVHISSHGPNNDGCDPESCKDVLIEDCFFDTGDDCIAIKSGRNNDGRRLATPSENIIVRNCIMKDGHGGVVMGSEISGGVRNVFVEDCKMDSPNLDRALRFKSNAKRGGVIENIFMRNVEVGRVAEAVLTIDFLYETGADGPHKPVVRNVVIENVRSASSPRVMWVAGFSGAVIEDVRFIDCAFRGVESSEVVQNAGSISFKNVSIEPAAKGRSRNSPETKP